jgi:hypothetical protein
MGDELVFLVRVGCPQETGHLVVAGADALEQLLDPTGRVAGAEGLLELAADLIRIAEPAATDFAFEVFDLRGREIA